MFVMVETDQWQPVDTWIKTFFVKSWSMQEYSSEKSSRKIRT